MQKLSKLDVAPAYLAIPGNESEQQYLNIEKASDSSILNRYLDPQAEFIINNKDINVVDI